MPQPTQAERLELLERKMADQEFQFSQFRAEVRAEFSALRVEMRQLIAEANEETHHLMRVLHEDVIARFAVLEERWNSRPPRRPGEPGTGRGRRKP